MKWWNFLSCMKISGSSFFGGSLYASCDPDSADGRCRGSQLVALPLLERRDALEASANERFEVVASGSVRINVNPRLALKNAADPTRH
jgi:hypothetical protein